MKRSEEEINALRAGMVSESLDLAFNATQEQAEIVMNEMSDIVDILGVMGRRNRGEREEKIKGRKKIKMTFKKE